MWAVQTNCDLKHEKALMEGCSGSRSLEGTFTQTDSKTSIILLSVGGIVGGTLHMLNQNRHY